MSANELQLGRRVDWTLAAGATSGSLVQISTNCVGVAQVSGTTGQTIAVAVQGVWKVAKDGSAFSAGDVVSIAGGVASSTGDAFGVALSDQVTGDATVNVLLTPSV